MTKDVKDLSNQVTVQIVQQYIFVLEKNLCGIVANVLDCDIVVSDFKVLSFC